MTPTHWQNTISKIKEKFEILEESSENLEGMPGTRESVVFLSPLGKVKLEFVRKPIVLDKKTIGSRRIGSETKVEYIYSDTEESCKLHVYRFDEAQELWEEMKADSLPQI